MSTAYPEGEVFFTRESLKTEGYDPEDTNQFYSNFLIEVATNEPDRWAVNKNPPGFRHTNPYAKHKKVVKKTGPLKHTYSYWDHWCVGYGAKDDVKRVVRYKNHGDALVFTERWFQRDPQRLLLPIRAVYFPLIQTADRKFDQLATFIQVNFYHQGKRKVWHTDREAFHDHYFTRERGTGIDGKWALGINVTDVMGLLSLPHHFRNTNVWDAKLVIWDKVKTGGPEAEDRDAAPGMDFVTLVNASLAVELAWRPPPPPDDTGDEWIFNVLKGIMGVALSTVPVAGPLLAASFTIGLTIVADKDNAVEYLASAKWTGDVTRAAAGSSVRIKKFLGAGWQGVNLLAGARGKTLTVGEAEAEEEKELDVNSIPPNPLLLDGLRALLEHDDLDPPDDDKTPPHGEGLEKAVRLGQISLKEAQGIEKVLDKAAEKERIRRENPEASEEDMERKRGCTVM
ncbi:hypothetical protein ASPWEDRAFT_22958 [Aspergillus wentii DTO 134E9]|uniref:Uncharacterized protein n=1 Tax=Aspergillus wentii DTO 134E9 TaxID=1073089 RepID=A0A1L9S0W4_ASPWE|nr:uncharacterized protein ASPWEDRAFT_22958 [Aspergillus wentii DTO 134E9]OJJ40811.1 hypothetical protein ASPWEDRAFT_22958 [Aspergillus wentii DTO 134E9]